MPGKRPRYLRWFSATILVVVAVGFASCWWSGGDSPALQRLPDTDQVHASLSTLTMSPDDRWLIFLELTGTNFDLAKDKSHHEFYQPASIDLRTGVKSVHRLPPELVEERAPLLLATQGALGHHGKMLWWGSRFSLGSEGRRRHLLLDPTQELLVVDRVPDEASGCSDCGPRERRIDRTEDLVLIGPDGQRETIARRPRYQLPLSNTSFWLARLSPDERFLVFVISRNRGIPILPAPSTNYTAYVQDLQSGGQKRLAQFRGISNPVFSSDSGRLYFAGDRGVSTPLDRNPVRRGIYVVELDELFPTE